MQSADTLVNLPKKIKEINSMNSFEITRIPEFFVIVLVVCKVPSK